VNERRTEKEIKCRGRSKMDPPSLPSEGGMAKLCWHRNQGTEDGVLRSTPESCLQTSASGALRLTVPTVPLLGEAARLLSLVNISATKHAGFEPQLPNPEKRM
ncbi:hypothetical protein T310_10295, partial [Rasamsonia emersonii CBS 393.64]